MIYIDADACPVKQEVYRVAERCALKVTLVANSFMRTPDWVRLEVVAEGPDVADDWIAEHAGQGDIVITADIPLADRCIKRGACVLTPTGREYSENNIGAAIATRNLLAGLREIGEVGGGPAPFSKRDRSNFLQQLDLVIQRIRRSQ